MKIDVLSHFEKGNTFSHYRHMILKKNLQDFIQKDEKTRTLQTDGHAAGLSEGVRRIRQEYPYEYKKILGDIGFTKDEVGSLENKMLPERE